MLVIGLNPTTFLSPKSLQEAFLSLFMLATPTLFASISPQNISDGSWMGNEAWTEALEWPGSETFHSASKKAFKVKSTGKKGGVYKGAEGLTFMKVSSFSLWV
jgi:carboxypeptidase C (cathepsin A)